MLNITYSRASIVCPKCPFMVPQNLVLFENFHTKSICGKISKKNQLAEKLLQQFALLENFHSRTTFLLFPQNYTLLENCQNLL